MRDVSMTVATHARRRARACAVTVSLLACALVPGAAWAQAGWYWIPSATVTEEFDDNILGTAKNRTADFISRVSVGSQSGYRSQPFTLLTSGGIDSELFAEHTERSGLANRIRQAIDVRYVPELTTTLRLNGAFVKTETPAELQPQLGIEQGRRTSTSLSFSPTVTHRFDRRTSADASYAYTRLESGAFESTTHQGALGVSTQITHVDTGTARYVLQSIESTGASATTSHALTLGWARKLSLTTDVSIQAGPRVNSEGHIEPDITASLTHRISKIATLALTYNRTETSVLGQPGTSETNVASANVTITPLRSLEILTGAALSRTTAPTGAETDVYRANAAVSYRLTKYLKLTVAYRFTFQDQVGGSISHNVVSIGLDGSYPVRTY